MLCLLRTLGGDFKVNGSLSSALPGRLPACDKDCYDQQNRRVLCVVPRVSFSQVVLKRLCPTHTHKITLRMKLQVKSQENSKILEISYSYGVRRWGLLNVQLTRTVSNKTKSIKYATPPIFVT